MEEYLKSSRGLDIPEHRHDPGTPITHRYAKDFSGESETGQVSVYTVGDREYRAGDQIVDLPRWLASYIEQDIKKAQHILDRLNEESDRFEKLKLVGAREVDSLKALMRQRKETDPVPSKSWELYIALTDIGLRPMQLQAVKVQELQIQLDMLMERWKLDFLRWFGAPLPILIELHAKKKGAEGKKLSKENPYAIIVSEPMLSRDETEVRREFLEFDVQFVYPQQWAILTESNAHMQDAQRRIIGGEAYAKMTNTPQRTPGGLIVPPTG